MAERLFVYSRFVKTKSDGTEVKLRIQEFRNCVLDNILHFMQKWYIHEESFVRASGIAKSTEAINEKNGIMIELLKSNDNNCLICCIDDDTSDSLNIVGVNYLYLSKKGENLIPTEFQTKEVASLFNIIKTLSTIYNELKELKVDSYMSGAGLSVDPSYRGCGIATALLEARRPLLQNRGLTVTGAWFTSAAAQQAAQKAGYVEVAEVEFKELERLTGLVFSDVPATTKLMITRI